MSSPTQIRTKRLKILPSAFRFPPTGLLRAAGHGAAPDGTNVFSSWPGEALTMDGDWYTIEVPGWINSVIINANEGSVQTADLSVEVGKDVWIVVSDAENATVSYEEPAGQQNRCR